MRRTGLILALFLAALARPAVADRAGEFDYYVLSLSWNASWCLAEGDRRDAPECDPARDIGFTLHGLWPQHERGWPEYCTGAPRDPSRRQTAAMADIMGSGGLAWYQWKKHGRCAGLPASDYFAAARRAWESVRRPAILRQVDRELNVAPAVIEEAFLAENPALSPDGITVTCKDGRLHEVRICLTRDLEPRTCGADVVRDCPARAISFPPMR